MLMRAGAEEGRVRGVRCMRMSTSQSSRTTETWAHDGGGKTKSVCQGNASLRAGRMHYRVCFHECEQ